MSTPKEIRLALKALLEFNLTDVEIWPGLLDSVPRLPAVVIRRGPYKVDTFFEEGSVSPAFDLLCCQSLDIPERALDMDDLVRDVLAAVRSNPTLNALVADIQIVGVGAEERLRSGGPNGSPMLAVGVTINVIT